jgi:pimeloyl-ACP methyl ester carboxylesterase
VPHIEPVVGRYYRIPLCGDEARIYLEEAGRGVPLVCLHTAGADSRQYRHLLNDPQVTDRFRVSAFDLPRHGRSLPPDRWWETEYLLTTDVYRDTVMAVADALELESPIVLGCSMGGSLVLELARAHADRLRGVIGVSGAGKLAGRFPDWPLHPDVNAQQSVPSWVYGLMAPHGPERDRRDVWWIYAQGGPGIYRGDTYFYSEDFDLRGREKEIDTARCPVVLMTGEYDYACAPEESARTAEAIPGAEFVRMRGIGHFPMAENYPLFRTSLLPVLSSLSER